MKKTISLLPLACLIIFASCGSSKQDPAELLAPFRWTLTSLDTGTGSLLPQADRFYWLYFRSDNTYKTRIDCNVCDGAYEADEDGNIAFGEAACTEMACPAGAVVDSLFTVALLQATTWDITGIELTIGYLTDDSLTGIITLQAETDSATVAE